MQPTVLSRDGTRIAFTRLGKGPSIILVDGALSYRDFGPSTPLAAELAAQFTVFTYDRRGRGGSGNTLPYAVEREVDDIAALIEEAGGSAFVFGTSSGAVLALEAANRGLPITKLVLYEAPFMVDDSRPPTAPDFRARLTEMISENRRADAVSAFMKLVGVPAYFVVLMRFMPMWSKLTGAAHTLPYDIEITEQYQRGTPLPATQWKSVKVPALVLLGGKSPTWMQHGMQALARLLQSGKLITLPGQTHMVKAKVVAPVLVEFLKGER